MRANPSSKALAVLLAVLASAVSSARAKQLRATAADEMDYSDKKNKGDKDKGDAIDSNDEPGRRQPGPSYGRAVQDLFGSVPVQVETRCSDGHEYRLISPEHCKPSLGGGGSSRNLQPGGGAKGNPDCSCVQTTLPPESAKWLPDVTYTFWKCGLGSKDGCLCGISRQVTVPANQVVAIGMDEYTSESKCNRRCGREPTDRCTVCAESYVYPGGMLTHDCEYIGDLPSWQQNQYMNQPKMTWGGCAWQYGVCPKISQLPYELAVE
mmetsp:Transcript_10811/g.23472  ORF Transcript_10811/g.23472 Transcript_10811/m.23472 type:complete len:265 (+) Transcript_10811:395-1189(+)